MQMLSYLLLLLLICRAILGTDWLTCLVDLCWGLYLQIASLPLTEMLAITPNALPSLFSLYWQLWNFFSAWNLILLVYLVVSCYCYSIALLLCFLHNAHLLWNYNYALSSYSSS